MATGIVRNLVTRLSFAVDWRQFTSIKRAVGSIKKDLTDFGKLVTGGVRGLVGLGSQVIAGVGSLSLFAKTALEGERALEALVKASGEARSDVKKLQTAFDLVGINNDKFQNIYQRITQGISEANLGYGDLLRTTQFIKTEAIDVNGKFKNTSQTIKAFVKYLQDIKDPGQRGIFSKLLFGQDLSPSELDALVNNIDDALVKAETLTTNLSDTDITQMNKFFGQLSQLKVVSTGWATQISTIILPALTSILGSFLDVNEQTRSLAEIYKDLRSNFDGMFSKFEGAGRPWLDRVLPKGNWLRDALQDTDDLLKTFNKDPVGNTVKGVDYLTRNYLGVPILSQTPSINITVNAPPGAPIADIKNAVMEAATPISENIDRQLRQMKDSNIQMSY